MVISRNTEVRNELVTLLSGYGYFVEYCRDRVEGMRKFRHHKQPIVILDVPTLRGFPKRLFRFIQLVRKNTIVLIAANKLEEAEALERVSMGAYDVLNLPLKTEFLKLTLRRALAHHRLTLENIFIKNALFFAIVLAPIWALLSYFLIR